jgi:hypothetical protein
MPVAVMQQFAFLHNVTSETVPVRGEIERCVYLTTWDLGKRMEGDVVKSNTQRIDEILIQSASSNAEHWLVPVDRGHLTQAMAENKIVSSMVHKSAISFNSDMRYRKREEVAMFNKAVMREILSA